MNGAVDSGPLVGTLGGQVSSSPQPQPGSLTPKALTVAQRLMELENKCSSLFDTVQRQERVITALMNQNAEMREEVGLAPVPPDYFA